MGFNRGFLLPTTGSSEISGQVFTDNQHLVGYGACSRSVQVVTARNVIYHPKFQPQFYQLRHDVALVLIPPLKATRFVAPIPLTFDMFDGASGISKECKIVGKFAMSHSSYSSTNSLQADKEFLSSIIPVFDQAEI